MTTSTVDIKYDIVSPLEHLKFPVGAIPYKVVLVKESVKKRLLFRIIKCFPYTLRNEEQHQKQTG